ncbi:MAG: alkaline phosphatase D family protein [Opitutaceae bacterium]|nr:alkaline phosphatase D family protein [Opitutaceae bacterium]
MPPTLFPLPGATSPLNRRTFLAGSASFVAAALLSTRARGATGAAPKFTAYPFSLGVASGDPLPDGIVLWTRLAPKPREPGGGLAPEPIEVAWQIAEDEAMTRVVQRGTATANPAWAHAIHVEVSGLQPARWYWYQFKAGSEVSPKGRTRTAPAADTSPDRLRFAFASCQNYGIGYYTAYEHMAREDLDLVVHLGDYIYEKGDNAGSVRPHGQKEIFTLDDYRERYAIYKSDPALQAMHAQVPWIMTWDDHEVSNDYAAAIAENPKQQPRAEFLKRRAAAYQVYFEHMPLRRSALPKGPDMLLYRRLGFGRLAQFHVLDTRQYRSAQLKPLRQPPSAAQLDPQRTIMGDRQREWLFDGLARSGTAWNVLAQQVPVGRIDRAPGPEVGLNMDKWPGYEFERRRLLRHLHDRKIANPVVITGDVHCNWATELPADFDQLDGRSVGVEFVGTSITSKGDGTEALKEAETFRGKNPSAKFFNDERGYVSCEVTRQAWHTHYRTVPFVSRRGAPLHTRASFVVEAGRSQLQQA